MGISSTIRNKTYGYYSESTLPNQCCLCAVSKNTVSPALKNEEIQYDVLVVYSRVLMSETTSQDTSVLHNVILSLH